MRAWVAPMDEPVPRVGIGFDAHPWSSVDRELWLGGVRFDGERGLAGHSDGDAVCHAIADALLGAAALGDVGQHFPDDDPSVAGISGARLLSRTVEIVRAIGLTPRSCDATVICERPAIAPRRDDLRARLGEALGLPIDAVSVKATRPEGLGLAGDGVGCMAVAVLA
jgi:2-C-methyl-D-erythritol 4-phosphate cytidylyltransferase/2-C-methyl-D-erythritol 2,4-cyclodiphosphate synthase